MKSDDDLVAEFIARRGVTKCPAALAAPTTVDIAESDAVAHAARGIDPAGDAWRKKNPGRYGRRRRQRSDVTKRFPTSSIQSS